MIETKVEKMNDVFTKYHILGLPFSCVIHHFTGLDGEVPHDHPYSFTSTILKGGYTERIWELDGTYKDVERKPGDTFKVYAGTVHQILHFPEGDCWTMILPGPGERTPGFYKFEDQVLHRFWNEEEFKPLSEN